MAAALLSSHNILSNGIHDAIYFESVWKFQNLSLLAKSVIRDKTSITCMLRASGVLLLAADFANNDPFAKHAIPHALQAWSTKDLLSSKKNRIGAFCGNITGGDIGGIFSFQAPGQCKTTTSEWGCGRAAYADEHPAALWQKKPCFFRTFRFWGL